MSAATLTYEFEELPLLRDGERFGLLSFGHAEIRHTEDDWSIERIFIDGFVSNGRQTLDADPLEITEDHPLWATAQSELTRYPFYGSILAAMADADRAGAFDDASDFIHDMRRAA